jgi:hypothetical protein
MIRKSITKSYTGVMLLSTLMLTPGLQAADNLYTVIGATYSKLDYAAQTVDDVTYKFVLGYQIDHQWYAEFGYQQLANQGAAQFAPETTQQADDFAGQAQGDALYAALLGKASGEMGELFYKIGVMKIDIKGQALVSAQQSCSIGLAGAMQSTNYQVCDYDEGSVAGIISMGFDFYLTEKTMLRTEVEYIKGQDKLEATTLQLGVRYNF